MQNSRQHCTMPDLMNMLGRRCCTPACMHARAHEYNDAQTVLEWRLLCPDSQPVMPYGHMPPPIPFDHGRSRTTNMACTCRQGKGPARGHALTQVWRSHAVCVCSTSSSTGSAQARRRCDASQALGVTAPHPHACFEGRGKSCCRGIPWHRTQFQSRQCKATCTCTSMHKSACCAPAAHASLRPQWRALSRGKTVWGCR